MRRDRENTVEAIAAELIKDPLATQKELAKRAGVSERTVERRIEQVAEVVGKDERIVSLTDADYEIVQLTQSLTMDKLKTEEEAKKISPRDLAYIGDVSAKRYSLLTGNVTNESGGLIVQPINYGNNTDTV